MAHLTSFTVENFKRFEHFEMNNIGQFNLIVGDNNVGKTSVLEALLIDEDPIVFANRLLVVLFKFRRFDYILTPYLEYFVRRSHKGWEQSQIRFYLNKQPITIDFALEAGDYGWSSPPFQGTRNLPGKNIGLMPDFPVPYVPFGQLYEHFLTELYAKNIQFTELKDQFLQDLQTFIPAIKDIEVDVYSTAQQKPILRISQHGIYNALPLGTFGDGAIKLFIILIDIVLHHNNRLMVDEIDSGVHTSHFRDFWRTILKAAKRHNVQLFATTHNWECLQVFKQVLEEEEMLQYQEMARCFTLIDSKVTQRVEAVCSTFAEFENAIETNTEIRGGAVV